MHCMRSCGFLECPKRPRNRGGYNCKFDKFSSQIEKIANAFQPFFCRFLAFSIGLNSARICVQIGTLDVVKRVCVRHVFQFNCGTGNFANKNHYKRAWCTLQWLIWYVLIVKWACWVDILLSLILSVWKFNKKFDTADAHAHPSWQLECNQLYFHVFELLCATLKMGSIRAQMEKKVSELSCKTKCKFLLKASQCARERGHCRSTKVGCFHVILWLRDLRSWLLLIKPSWSI